MDGGFTNGFLITPQLPYESILGLVWMERPYQGGSGPLSSKVRGLFSMELFGIYWITTM